MAESDDEEGTGVLGKLVMSGIVLAASTLTEIGTGPAPLGALGALVGLAVIWGFEDEAEQIQEAS
jgi:hypothetical protein